MVRTKKKVARKVKGPGDDLQGSIILLHGPYKVGKTTLISEFPKTWILGTEPGHKYVREGVRVTRLEDWDDFLGIIEGPWPSGCRTLAVDIVDNLYRMCRQAYCSGVNIKHPQDQPYRGWDMIKDSFITAMEKLTIRCEKNNITLILVTHTKEELVEVESGSYTKFATTLTGQARSVILPIPDHIWFLGYYNADVEPDSDAVKRNNHKRSLWFRGGEVVEAGCRDRNMKHKLIKVLKETGSYKQIVDTMNRPIKEK